MTGEECRELGHVHFRDPATQRWRCAQIEDARMEKQEARDRANAAEKMRRIRERRRREAMA